jgi:hypothetical protein
MICSFQWWRGDKGVTAIEKNLGYYCSLGYNSGFPEAFSRTREHIIWEHVFVPPLHGRIPCNSSPHLLFRVYKAIITGQMIPAIALAEFNPNKQT